REMLQLADVDFADQAGNILIILVAGLSFGDSGLAQARRKQLGDAELRDVSPEFVQPLHRPRRDDAVQTPYRNAVAVLQRRPHAVWIEKSERGLENWAGLVAGFQHVNRQPFH